VILIHILDTNISEVPSVFSGSNQREPTEIFTALGVEKDCGEKSLMKFLAILTLV